LIENIELLKKNQKPIVVGSTAAGESDVIEEEKG